MRDVGEIQPGASQVLAGQVIVFALVCGEDDEAVQLAPLCHHIVEDSRAIGIDFKVGVIVIGAAARIGQDGHGIFGEAAGEIPAGESPGIGLDEFYLLAAVTDAH